MKDILVEITGRTKNDQVIQQIYGTFDALKSFIASGFQATTEGQTRDQGMQREKPDDYEDGQMENGSGLKKLGLSYHINIVLPETKDIAVFNAIFQSLKQNLLV